MGTLTELKAKVRARCVKEGYRFDAYDFVGESIGLAMKRAFDTMRANGENGRPDVKAKDIVAAASELAAHQFGGMRRLVFDLWGLKHSRDIGTVVRGLVELKLLGEGKDDDYQEFDDLDIDFMKKWEDVTT